MKGSKSMTKNEERRPTVVMPATRLLQAKVGKGKVSTEKVGKAEEKINSVRGHIDIGPFAEEHMEEIAVFLDLLKNDDPTENITQDIARSIMKFKGNAGMFSGGSFVNLAAIMLRWIESVEEIDKDVLDVLNGYYVTLDQIFSNKLKDQRQINAIVSEMQAACERYFAKHPELNLTAEISNANAFYVSQKELNEYSVGGKYDSELSDDKLIGDED